MEEDAESGEEAEEVEVPGQKGKGPSMAAPQLTQDNVEATVFVRGLPLDALQYELQDRMSRFGKLKACRCESMTTYIHEHPLLPSKSLMKPQGRSSLS